jgi:uncharacterized protein (TIGR02594 family)
MKPTLRMRDPSDTRYRAEGDSVRVLQRLLRSTGASIAVDGDFGPATFAAVRAFQMGHGLTPDGVVGPKTWASLEAFDGGPAAVASAVAPIPRRGARLVAKTPVVNGPEWMTIAERELGQHEVVGAEANSRIVEYHAKTSLGAKSDEVPWCSSFVNWVVAEAGLEGTNDARAASWMEWGIESEARYGAIAVIQRRAGGFDSSTGSSSGFHVGFVVDSTDTHVRLLGGNQADSVKVSSFGLGGYRIRALRWPS